MYQIVLATFVAVAIPPATSVRDPVVDVPANCSVSELIAMVSVLTWFTNVITVPTG
jgi:hypothetical protein